MEQEPTKASDRSAKQTLYAPVDGQIQQLAISTVGGVVTDAQQLMIIVPLNEQLEVEVALANKDVGFVQEGMPAEIKVHTFPFVKYGIIDGEVSNISDDAIFDERSGYIYGMRVAMAEDSIRVNGNEIQLMPGMTVTAEIKLAKRRIIEFVLAPLMRWGSEGLRER